MSLLSVLKYPIQGKRWRPVASIFICHYTGVLTPPCQFLAPIIVVSAPPGNIHSLLVATSKLSHALASPNVYKSILLSDAPPHSLQTFNTSPLRLRNERTRPAAFKFVTCCVGVQVKPSSVAAIARLAHDNNLCEPKYSHVHTRDDVLRNRYKGSRWYGLLLSWRTALVALRCFVQECCTRCHTRRLWVNDVKV